MFGSGLPISEHPSFGLFFNYSLGFIPDTISFSDLDDSEQRGIDIYSGRGLLIESSGPVWLVGTGEPASPRLKRHLY